VVVSFEQHPPREHHASGPWAGSPWALSRS
jgi:hypothetical protein